MSTPDARKAVKCQRCGRTCIAQPTAKPDAILLRRGVKGTCVDCAVTEFIQRLTSMHVYGAIRGLPGSLRLPHVQQQFIAVMRAGGAEANPDEISWERVIENWNIAPAPKGGLF
jgi:hypothetical protein